MTEAIAPLPIDTAVDARQSVALRYAPALAGADLTPGDLAATSQREGLRLLELQPYCGVRLMALDETTLMRTGTYKSLDGCVTAALCRRQGVRRVAFSSGANTGVALTAYGRAAGLETWFFCPRQTLYKLDGAMFDDPQAHLIVVDGPDHRVKAAARQFAEAAEAQLAPTLAWRLRAASCRGLFLAEQIVHEGQQFDWFAQAICAAYGPVGAYEALASYVDRPRVPKLLAVQQAALAPIAEAWAARRPQLQHRDAPRWRQTPIEPSLYNANPHTTYPMLFDLLSRFGGDVTALSFEDFNRYAPAFADRLTEAGVTLTRAGGQWLEKAGLMAGAAALCAVDQGGLQPGQTVLCALTGGAGPAPTRPAQPQCVIGEHDDPAATINAYIEALNHVD